MSVPPSLQVTCAPPSPTGTTPPLQVRPLFPPSPHLYAAVWSWSSALSLAPLQAWKKAARTYKEGGVRGAKRGASNGSRGGSHGVAHCMHGMSACTWGVSPSISPPISVRTSPCAPSMRHAFSATLLAPPHAATPAPGFNGALLCALLRALIAAPPPSPMRLACDSAIPAPCIPSRRHAGGGIPASRGASRPMHALPLCVHVRWHPCC